MFERAISAISPKWAFKRSAYQNAMRVTAASTYHGGDTSQGRYRVWRNLGRSAPNIAHGEHSTIMRRANELYRDNPLVRNIIDILADNIVGSNGVRLQSRIPDDTLRKQAEAAWELFSERPVVGSTMSLQEALILITRRALIDGELFILPVMYRKGDGIKRRMQLVDAERVWSTGTGGLEHNGIVVDSMGVPVAYMVESGSGVESISTSKLNLRRIPATDSRGRPNMLHYYVEERPGQLRGVSALAPVLNTVRDLGDYLENELILQQVSACLGVFISTDSPYQMAYAAADGTDSSGQQVQDLSPAEIYRLKPGERIEVVDPKRPGNNIDAFVERICRLIGVGIGLPYEMVMRDYSKTTYSSARSVLLETRRGFVIRRNRLIHRVLRPLYRLVLEEAYLRGMFDAGDYYANERDYLAASWIGSGWGWVDPVKEVSASQLSIEANLSTLAEEASSQGRDWEDVLEQRAREIARQRELMGDSTNENNGGVAGRPGGSQGASGSESGDEGDDRQPE